MSDWTPKDVRERPLTPTFSDVGSLLSDADKLRILADYFDGIAASGTEVQDDLRRIATRLEAVEVEVESEGEGSRCPYCAGSGEAYDPQTNEGPVCPACSGSGRHDAFVAGLLAALREAGRMCTSTDAFLRAISLGDGVASGPALVDFFAARRAYDNAILDLSRTHPRPRPRPKAEG